MVMTSTLSYDPASYRRSAGGAEATATTSCLSVMAFLETLLQSHIKRTQYFRS